jgi:hypothetical protein
MHKKLRWIKNKKKTSKVDISLTNPSNINIDLTDSKHNNNNSKNYNQEEDEDYWKARNNSIRRSKSSSNSFYYSSSLFKKEKRGEINGGNVSNGNNKLEMTSLANYADNVKIVRSKSNNNLNFFSQTLQSLFSNTMYSKSNNMLLPSSDNNLNFMRKSPSFVSYGESCTRDKYTKQQSVDIVSTKNASFQSLMNTHFRNFTNL